MRLCYGNENYSYIFHNYCACSLYVHTVRIHNDMLCMYEDGMHVCKFHLNNISRCFAMIRVTRGHIFHSLKSTFFRVLFFTLSSFFVLLSFLFLFLPFLSCNFLECF